MTADVDDLEIEAGVRRRHEIWMRAYGADACEPVSLASERALLNILDALRERVRSLARLPRIRTCGDCAHRGSPGAVIASADGVRPVAGTSHCRKATELTPGAPPPAALLPGEYAVAKWPVVDAAPPPSWCPLHSDR